MAESTKPLSEYDYQQVFQKAYNKESSTIGIDGFISGVIGRKISVAISTTTIADDTETYSFSENSKALYTITVIYTDGTRETLLSVERTA